MLALILLAVPVIIYDRFRNADETQQELLLRGVREQGRVIAQALAPLLSSSTQPPLPQLGRELARFADNLTNVRLLLAPSDGRGVYYIASWPVVPTSALEAERERLQQQGVLGRLTATCKAELPEALRYTTPDGKDEIVSSITPLKTPSGCWAVITSFPADAMPGTHLGRPYWQSREVQIAAAIYLAMVLLTFTTFWSIRRGLRRFAERARAIREHRPGGSFAAQRDVPELANVAREFDDMVAMLAASARDIRRTAEDNAHAFKTPIAVIRQSLEPLKRTIDPENRRGQSALAMIERSLDRLDGLVASSRRLDEATADLMDMPRTAIDLSSLMARLLQSHAPVLAGRRLQLKGHIQAKVIVHAHEDMLETVVENLFDNAISFSPDGETIGVRLEERGTMAELLIGDGGPGVQPENLDRIFDRYFSQRRRHDGAALEEATHFGIGLWIARRNVEALGGTINAENRKPHGLLMRVRLPLASAGRLAGPAERPLLPNREASPGRS